MVSPPVADTLVAESKQLTSRIAHLCEEVEHLRVVYSGLRGKAQAAALAALDARADLEIPLPPLADSPTVALPTPDPTRQTETLFSPCRSPTTPFGSSRSNSIGVTSSGISSRYEG